MKIGCVILAGGKSSRMGTDKALLKIDDKTFIQQIMDELNFFDEKFISSNHLMIEDKTWTIVSDEYFECGPIAGLHAVLKRCESDALFCIACDMPFIQRSLVEEICYKMMDHLDAVIVRDSHDRVHPLCAIYKKEVYSIFEEQILSGNNKLMSAIDKMKVQYITIHFKEEAQQLLNINTPKDYREMK